MSRLLTTLLLLTLILGACQKSRPAPQLDTTKPEASALPASVQSPATTTRQAVVTEIKNTANVRLTSDSEALPAESGMVIQTGGGLETGDDGHARMDLKPEGTIVRVGPNSSFLIPQITEENGQPKTTIQLLFGKMYILLNGGSLDVKTASGTASVRGSLLGVEYYPGQNAIKATCFEGHCALENEQGNEVELDEGESSYIEGDNAPTEPEVVDQEDVQALLDETPELPEFMEELPNPEDFPDYQDPFDQYTPEDGNGDPNQDGTLNDNGYIDPGLDANSNGDVPTEAPVTSQDPPPDP